MKKSEQIAELQAIIGKMQNEIANLQRDIILIRAEIHREYRPSTPWQNPVIPKWAPNTDPAWPYPTVICGESLHSKYPNRICKDTF